MPSTDSEPEQEQYQYSNEDVEQLNKMLADNFQDAQKSLAGHRKIVITLANIQHKASQYGMEEEFNKGFSRLMNRVLPIKKNEGCADRMVKLCQSFCDYVQKQQSKYIYWEYIVKQVVLTRFCSRIRYE